MYHLGCTTLWSKLLSPSIPPNRFLWVFACIISKESNGILTTCILKHNQVVIKGHAACKSSTNPALHTNWFHTFSATSRTSPTQITITNSWNNTHNTWKHVLPCGSTSTRWKTCLMASCSNCAFHCMQLPSGGRSVRVLNVWSVAFLTEDALWLRNGHNLGTTSESGWGGSNVCTWGSDKMTAKRPMKLLQAAASSSCSASKSHSFMICNGWWFQMFVCLFEK